MDQEFENENISSENTEEVDISEECASESKISNKFNKKKGWKRELLEWVESLGISIIAALLIVNFVFTLVRVEGASMEPTLQTHNCLFVFRLGYTPESGDIVVFKPVGNPKKYYIKRVIATEGQEVNLADGKVYVDGELVAEDYTKGKTLNVYNAEFPQKVPENCFFVLGDNRENSRDSRDSVGVGMVERKSIAGKALFRLFPFNEIGGLYK